MKAGKYACSPSWSLLQKYWFCIVEAFVEKCPIRQSLRQRLPTKFSATLTFATAFSWEDSGLPGLAPAKIDPRAGVWNSSFRNAHR